MYAGENNKFPKKSSQVFVEQGTPKSIRRDSPLYWISFLSDNDDED